MTTGVVDNVYLVFNNNLGFFSWFITVRRVKALVKTSIPTPFLIISLNSLMVTNFTSKRIDFSSRCLDHLLRGWLLFFKINLRDWTCLCLNLTFLLTADFNLFLWPLMNTLSEFVISHLENVRFWIIWIALTLILLSTSVWMIRIVSCNSAVECQLLLKLHQRTVGDVTDRLHVLKILSRSKLLTDPFRDSLVWLWLAKV